MEKFYLAYDEKHCDFVVMEHINGHTKEVCRGEEASLQRVISSMEFLYVTAVDSLKKEQPNRVGQGVRTKR